MKRKTANCKTGEFSQRASAALWARLSLVASLLSLFVLFCTREAREWNQPRAGWGQLKPGRGRKSCVGRANGELRARGERNSGANQNTTRAALVWIMRARDSNKSPASSPQCRCKRKDRRRKRDLFAEKLASNKAALTRARCSCCATTSKTLRKRKADFCNLQAREKCKEFVALSADLMKLFCGVKCCFRRLLVSLEFGLESRILKQANRRKRKRKQAHKKRSKSTCKKSTEREMFEKRKFRKEPHRITEQRLKAALQVWVRWTQRETQRETQKAAFFGRRWIALFARFLLSCEFYALAFLLQLAAWKSVVVRCMVRSQSEFYKFELANVFRFSACNNPSFRCERFSLARPSRNKMDLRVNLGPTKAIQA